MIIETDDVMVGLAWDLEKAEAVLDADYPSYPGREELINLPIVVLAITAPDEGAARELWQKKHPHLEINTIFPLNTLIDEGAVS